MGQTLTEQILSRKAGRPVSPGELLVIEPDLAMTHDSLTPTIAKIMAEQLGQERVRYPQRHAVVIDHVAPPSNLATAEAHQTIRRFVAEQGTAHFFESGAGICHQLLVQEGLAQPGMVIVGSDSHSTSYGAVGAFGTGMGSTDLAIILATGQTWLRVPETLRVQVEGRFPQGVQAKDLALKLGRDLTIAGATYMAVEYQGLDWLDLPGRQTLASMAVELGAKAGIVPPTGEAANGWETPDWLYLDPEARYSQEHEVDLDSLRPQVALPHAVDNVVDIDEVAGLKVDVVFVGTCTNGRYQDLRTVADYLKGEQIAPSLRLLVTPASRSDMARAAADGTLAALLMAGATLGTPGCGPCMGRQQGTLALGEVCLSTGNRNFRGRMGSPEAQIFLASPAVAGATALTGAITDPTEVA